MMKKSKLTKDELNKYRLDKTRSEEIPFTCEFKSKEEYMKILDKESYDILFADGTERAFSHPYNDLKERGYFSCKACGQPLFGMEAKFDSGTGWPSFYAPLSYDKVEYEKDFYLLVPRIAVLCSCCRGHLGHVFPDGPNITGFRYCLNGMALEFNSEEDE